MTSGSVRRSLTAWWWPLLTAAAAAVIVYFAVSLPLRERTNDLERKFGSLQSQFAEMQSTRNRTEQQISLPRSTAMQFVEMKGTTDAPGAIGNLYWDHARGVWYLYTTGLKPPGVNRAYELWFIAGDKKTRAGVFQVTPDGEGSLVAAVPPDLGTLTLAAITDEPVGGSDQPTGKIRVAGILAH